MAEDGGKLDLPTILTEAANRMASDLHLSAGAVPMLRISKELVPMQSPPLDGPGIENLIAPHLMEGQTSKFHETGCLNFTFHVPAVGRFRVNLYRSKGEMGASIRVLTLPVRPFKDLGLPETAGTLFNKSSGMIVVAGATGSGKSTTLASIVQMINQGNRPRKIVMVEDPIEYELESDKGLVVQREVGTDTPSFNAALIDALRQDPNIIVIGELRDTESILTSLIAAETGHLLLTTLHTPDAPSTMSRLISAIPAAQQELVRHQLSSCLQAVIAQELLPRADKKGLALAGEVMVATEAVKRLIRENKPEQIYDMMQTGSGTGMVSKDRSLTELVKAGIITKEAALPRMRNPQMLHV